MTPLKFLGVGRNSFNVPVLLLVVFLTASYLCLRIYFPQIRAYSMDETLQKDNKFTIPGKEEVHHRNIATIPRTSDSNSPFSLNPSFQENITARRTDVQHTVFPQLVETANFSNSPPYQLFQSAQEVDFPTVDAHAPRIPHIIHQMYADELIPDIYTDHVKSFVKNNPTWEYRFWTDKSGRKLLEKYHPYLLNVYDRFGNNVKRSDLLRYAVLYEFGGFYADLDVDNLRSLNRTTTKYACIVSVEPFEHSVLLNNMEFLMNNAIMSCRPKHPFFKQLLSDLKAANPQGYPVGTTGPGYVTRQFYRYNEIRDSQHESKTDLSSNSPYFYKGEHKEDDENAVYVPNSQYFMDKLDPIHTKKDGKFTKICSSIESLPNLLRKRACVEFHRRKTVRENKKYTFTVHHWYHLWEMKKASVNGMKMINISNVVPNCIFYNVENVTLNALM